MSKTPNKKAKNEYQIVIGPNVKVTEDKRSKSRVAHFPFEFPDSTNGVIIVLRLKDDEWTPQETIDNINITFT